ncbi:hypothetical protein PHYSODRAFT_311246 [Phytophthora sojae]|uniref:Uncharacterized protein n=1 Tax=Phytophthora sojae (strain P6497) TaxID=1094619 RepID=G4YS18_PHYSP|nr:hypothetical protein PHYSODRAFT_311246 [Phytophthora sojae]EGZ24155.1 hypothetical protein PHYSODRAFT_311246 [Phytophthora sojae]|eukprot:XP_009519443.1 hypothetical protein PHYSODRAFT_311246 [Phytophthora sojae]
MEDTAALRRELQQLSPAQLRELLSASGHGQLLRDEAAEEEEKKKIAVVDEQLVAAAKDEGNAFFRQGQMQDAVAAYSRCIAMDPSNAVCLSNRAAAYLKLKQFDLAVADCSKAIEVAPTIKPFMRRSAAYVALRQFGKAVDDLIAALEFEPRNKECRTKLQVIVDTAAERPQRADPTADAKLRDAGFRAAVALSVREGWSKTAVRGNPGPAAVNGHTLFRGRDDRVYLFGGRAVREQKPVVFVLDKKDDSSWDTVPTRGTDVPSSRAWHSTSAIGSMDSECYCVYGGVSSKGEDPNVHLLVPTSPRGFQWQLARCSQDPKQVPAPRSGHAAVSVADANEDRAVYIFGGRTKQGITGTQPQRLIVFGGNGQLNDERMNDTWLFDVEKKRWALVQCSGDVPPPRSYHTAHTIGDFLFVIGGRTVELEDDSVYMLDVIALKWSKVPIPTDRALTPRAWHSSVLTKAGKLFVLGGGTYHGPLKDAATLDLSYFKDTAASQIRTTV